VAIIRWNPLRTTATLERQMRDVERMFRRPFETSAWQPAIDVFVEDGKLVVQMEAPGLNPDEDLDIDVTDNVLRIRGRRVEESERREEQVYVRERRAGTFQREIVLPDGVDSDQMTASYDGGVLTVTVPLPDEAAPEGRSIPIQVSKEDRETS
jgi:HSP20 family protein